MRLVSLLSSVENSSCGGLGALCPAFHGRRHCFLIQKTCFSDTTWRLLRLLSPGMSLQQCKDLRATLCRLDCHESMYPLSATCCTSSPLLLPKHGTATMFMIICLTNNVSTRFRTRFQCHPHCFMIYRQKMPKDPSSKTTSLTFTKMSCFPRDHVGERDHEE